MAMRSNETTSCLFQRGIEAHYLRLVELYSMMMRIGISSRGVLPGASGG